MRTLQLFDHTSIHELLSGRARGTRAAILRGVLGAVEVPYKLAIRHRNRRFDAGHQVRRVDVPVISVGNLTTGGTGKTPMVEWIARWYCERNVRVSLISRGYGTQRELPNDEALELEQKLPTVPHVQNPDRVAAANSAIEKFQSQVIILDDAFQHRRIHRDLDIVLIDALEPFGYGRLLPRGLLREPIAGISRADIVVLTRADMVDDEERTTIHGVIRQHAPHSAWIETAHKPHSYMASSGHATELESLGGKRVAAFCGIGNPRGFRHTLQSCKIELAGFKEFPDHHPFRREDVEDISDWTETLGELSAIVCTQKDLVKMDVERIGDLPLFALSIGMDIQHGQDSLEMQLQQLLTQIQECDADQ